MGTVVLETIRESLFRRMGLALLLMSALVTGLFFWYVRYEKLPNGSMVVHVGGMTQPPLAYAASHFSMLLSLTSTLWVFLGIFACAPLLTTFLEKGWAEMLLSKGIARWKLLLGRFSGALIVYVLALILLDAAPAFYIWVRAGAKPWYFLGAVGVLLFSFVVTLSLMLLAGVATAHSGVPILFGFLQLFLSSALFAGKDALLHFFTSATARWLVEWAYRILPKSAELQRFAEEFSHSGKHGDWWPVWTSALFMLAMLACAQILFHRKDS